MSVRKKPNKISVIIGVLLAALMILTALFMVHIVDRTHEGVTAIQQTKVIGPEPKFTSAVTDQNELAVFTITPAKNGMSNVYAADHKITVPEWEKIASAGPLFEVKLKRCDLDADQIKKLASVQTERLLLIEMDVNEDVVQSISKIKDLQNLQFYKCDLQLHIFKPIRTTAIKRLAIRNCLSLTENKALDRFDMENLSAMPDLRRLELEETAFFPAMLSCLELSNLRTLNCRRCNLTDREMVHFTKIPHLNNLDIARNPAITCAGLRTLLDAKQIHHILFEVGKTKCVLNDTEKARFEHKTYFKVEKSSGD